MPERTSFSARRVAQCVAFLQPGASLPQRQHEKPHGTAGTCFAPGRRMTSLRNSEKTTEKNGNQGQQDAGREQDVAETDLGLSRKQRQGSIGAMNSALANASILTIKTKKFHWDVVGPQFMTLHKLWDEQYETLAEYADETAERIRSLGGFPIGTAQGFLKNTELKEHPGDVPNATEAVQLLLRDHEAIVRSLRQAIKRCDDEFEDSGTADFLTGMLKGHERMAWMLRSFLLGSGVEPSGEVTHGPVPSLA